MFRFFTSDLRRNLTKIVCLTIGLAMGFLLVAKIYFQQTYDSSLPDIDRLYKVTESAVNNGEYQEWNAVPGGTTPELKRLLPQIEAATRYTLLSAQTVIKLDDGRMFEVDAISLADSCLFDVLKTEIITGNPHDELAVEDHVMIPLSLAEKIGGDVVGLRISNVGWGDSYHAIIGGVYEDFPLNSSFPNSLWISMPTVGKLIWDGSENLLGNDRYQGFVRLAKGVNPDDLHTPIMEHLRKLLPEEAFTISDYKVWLRPLKGSYSSQNGVRLMSLMLGLLSVVLLMCAALNYLLIVIAQLAARGKEMAIRKCYGTGRMALFGRVMGESLFFLIVSVGLAVIIAFAFTDTCKELLGYTPKQLFSTGRVWIVEGIVCLVLLIITGVIPAMIYSRTPVAYAFRATSRSRKGWKLALLAIQFFATGLIMCLLVLVVRQYHMVGHIKMGFDYENIGWFRKNGMPDDRTLTILKELEKLPFVEKTASADYAFGEKGDGNMTWTEEMYERQTNIGDLYGMNPAIADVMGLKFTQGRNFREHSDSTINEIIVEERYADILHKVFEVPEGDVIGQTVYITGHGPNTTPFTIIGVIENIHRGGYENDRADTRAGVIFPSNQSLYCNYVRFTELTPENLKEAQKVIDSLKDGAEVYITPLKADIDTKGAQIRRFGTSVMVVGIVIILIALIGLIGYVADEVNRRAKEIAIRKVNGTTASQIVHLFCIDILRIAIPSLIAGGVVAMLIGRQWLSQFTERVGLSPLSMILCLVVLTLLITGVVILNSLRVARSNPVDHLRSE